MTYLKHNDVLEKNEIAGILKLCEQYTKMFVEANEYLKEMMEGMVAYKDDADGQMWAFALKKNKCCGGMQ